MSVDSKMSCFKGGRSCSIVLPLLFMLLLSISSTSVEELEVWELVSSTMLSLRELICCDLGSVFANSMEANARYSVEFGMNSDRLLEMVLMAFISAAVIGFHCEFTMFKGPERAWPEGFGIRESGPIGKVHEVRFEGGLVPASELSGCGLSALKAWGVKVQVRNGQKEVVQRLMGGFVGMIRPSIPSSFELSEVRVVGVDRIDQPSLMGDSHGWSSSSFESSDFGGADEMKEGQRFVVRLSENMAMSVG